MLFWLSLFLMATAISLAAINWQLWTESRQPWRKLPRYSVERTDPHFRGNPGPWGELEYARINIEPPDLFVMVDEREFAPTQWFFEGFSPEQLETFLMESSLTETQRAELSDKSHWTIKPGGITLTPRSELILQLSRESRTKIYSALALSPRNEMQRWPYTYRQGGFDDWFHGSELSLTTIALARQLVYPRGASLCFSDLPEIFPTLSDIAERRRLLKTVSRQSALLMKLRVHPRSDVKSLTAYWARGGRAKDVQPLLDSLTKVPDSITLDVAHLLPPFARKRLNTFPSPDPTVPGGDCFWTAMNFFNDPPDDRYHQADVWTTELAKDYRETDTPTFGDLMFLLRPDGSPIHAAVYIADDVVFTKNGGNFRQPWSLQKWEDMVARYPESSPLRVAIFHKKLP